MRPPNERGPGRHSPDPTTVIKATGCHTSETSGDNSEWRQLLTERPELPAEKLQAPTLGAIRRQAGHIDDPCEWVCEEARIAFAVELIREAQRRVLLDVLDSIMQFLAVGATPDQAMARIRKLVAEYDSRPVTEAAA
jgi:hypothetical protein